VFFATQEGYRIGGANSAYVFAANIKNGGYAEVGLHQVFLQLLQQIQVTNLKLGICKAFNHKPKNW